MIINLLENFTINDCALLLSAALMTYVAYYYYTYFTRVNPLPGPIPIPFIGNLPHIHWQFKGDAQMFYDYCHEKYGDIYEIYSTYTGVRSIVLCRKEYIENFLSERSAHWTRFPNFKGPDELGIEGKGLVFNNNFKSWIYNRHFFLQAIMSPKFTDEAIDWTNERFNKLDSYWNKLFLKEEIIKENKNIFNMFQWLNQYSFDMIIKLLTGKRPDLMKAYFDTFGDEKSGPSAIVCDSAKIVQALRIFLADYAIFYSISPFLRHYFPFFKNKADNLLQNMKFVNKKLDAIIKKRRQEIEDIPLDEHLPHDILTSMIIKNTLRDVNYIEAGKATKAMTDTEIRGNLFDGLLGGCNKTANMLSFIIYYISRNPDVKKKMLKEIDSIFQDDKIRPITKDDYYSLSYCEAIVKEVARILPAMRSFSRYTNKSDKIAGYQWPAGITFIIDIKAIHNKDDYWEEPNRFNPDRWMVENFEPKKNSFIMFGGGLRSCPGRKLAMIELVCTMVLLFRKYDINLVDTNSPIKTRSIAIFVDCFELLVEIKPRN
ncbi:sterol 14-demethylase [Rhizophagus irregularis DAOM 197198w]|uniref:Sterol 14-demethylase n=4 Tax=Rhizophagus irregularis TaxID=588596 RepID=A0A015N7Z4_RHIIW|nr:sterol 14-demethylase [Rhizophagus irregularis DAOM 197198w]